MEEIKNLHFPEAIKTNARQKKYKIITSDKKRA
jgi:hypothetical protein